MKRHVALETNVARRRSRIGLAVVAFAALASAGAWLVLRDAPDRPDHASDGSGTDARAALPVATAGLAAGAALPLDPPELPAGALPPIIGEPRLDRIDYCDARNWTRVDVLVRELRGDELIVDESAWLDAGASTRAGLASWVSKCRFEGRSLVVRAEGSGRELGAYDTALGYEALD